MSLSNAMYMFFFATIFVLIMAFLRTNELQHATYSYTQAEVQSAAWSGQANSVGGGSVSNNGYFDNASNPQPGLHAAAAVLQATQDQIAPLYEGSGLRSELGLSNGQIVVTVRGTLRSTAENRAFSLFDGGQLNSQPLTPVGVGLSAQGGA